MKTKAKESGTWLGLKWLKYRRGNNARGTQSLGKFSTLSHPSLPWVIVNKKALLVLRSNFRPFCLLCPIALSANTLKRIPKNIIKFKHFVTTVLYSNVWSQWSSSETALSTCKTRVLKKNILNCQKVRLYLKKREKGAGRDIYIEGYKNKKSDFAKQEKLMLVNFGGC